MNGESGKKHLSVVGNVDQDAGNLASQLFYDAAKSAWDNRDSFLPIVEYGEGFSSFRGMPLDAIGATGYIISAGDDGVGTKIEAAERMEDHSTIGHDLVAMSCDDAVIRGGQPIALTNVLDVNGLEKAPDNALSQLARGLQIAAGIANVAILNGETAELGDRVNGYGPFNYNWSSTALWMVQRDRIIDNTAIEPGDLLVGFEETGLRSNGLTTIRNTFRHLFGPEWHETEVEVSGEPQHLGQLALQPSAIYTPLMVELTGGCDPNREPKAEIRGATQISGGGIPEKLGRILRNTGYGAEIVDPFEPPEIALLAQANHPGKVLPDEDAYKTWCFGQGMIVVIPEAEAEKVIKTATEHKITTKVMGYVTDEPGIRIRSRGIQSPGQMLVYPAA